MRTPAKWSKSRLLAAGEVRCVAGRMVNWLDIPADVPWARPPKTAANSALSMDKTLDIPARGAERLLPELSTPEWTRWEVQP